MHIQTDLIEQQCERSGPTDYFTISPFPPADTFCSCCHTSLTEFSLLLLLLFGQLGLLSVLTTRLSDATALKPGKKSENGFHMPMLVSGSLSHSKPRPACSECHQRKLPNRQTEDVHRLFPFCRCQKVNLPLKE